MKLVTSKNILHTLLLLGAVIAIVAAALSNIPNIEASNIDSVSKYDLTYTEVDNNTTTGNTYKLPFPAGQSYVCTQGNNEGSHTGKGAYAFDFAMSPGDVVVASRSGTVSKIEQGYGPGGYDPYYLNRANYVVIDHGDGTSALYLHLWQGRVLVSVGQYVVQGQAIALSGSSGYVTGPHLHFQVEETGSSWWTQSVPFEFEDANPLQAWETAVSQNYLTDFHIGDQVVTINDTYVRSDHFIGDNTCEYRFEGSTGLVTAGPEYADGYTWWQVDFGRGRYYCEEGWLTQDCLGITAFAGTSYPVNILPSSGSATSMTPDLSSSAYFDKYEEDLFPVHEVQIRESTGTYSAPVFDSGPQNINVGWFYSIPPGILDYSTTYYWRARYQNNNGIWSDYSQETSFSTQSMAGPIILMNKTCDNLDYLWMDMTLDSQDNIILAGINTARDCRIIKYDPSGNPLWDRTYDSGGDDLFTSVGVDSIDNIVISGSSSVAYQNLIITKYSSSGTQLWAISRNGYFIVDDMAIDSQNRILVSGESIDYDSGQWVPHLWKFSSNGVLLWEKTYPYVFMDCNDTPTNVEVDSTNNVVFIFRDDVNRLRRIIKYDTNGNQLWQRPYYLEYWLDQNQQGETKLILDSDGSIVLVDCTDISNPNVTIASLSYITVTKYDPNGHVLWQQTFHNWYHLDPSTAVIDSDHNILVTCDPFSWLLKFDTNGTLLFSEPLPDGYDDADYVAMNSQGQIILAGEKSIVIYGSYNHISDQPSNLLPADESEDVTLSPILTASAFSDQDASDYHAASKWQISDIPDSFALPLFDSGVDTGNLSHITVPAGILDFSKTYYWRVRYQDRYGDWSDWSSASSFTTESKIPEYWDVPYKIMGFQTTTRYSISGDTPGIDTIEKQGSECGHLTIRFSKDVVNGQREVIIPASDFYLDPYSISVHYSFFDVNVLLNTALSDDAAGVLYVQDNTGYVDVFSESSTSTSPQQINTVGDGTYDPAGSLLMYMPIQTAYNVMQYQGEIPYDLIFTTGYSYNHITLPGQSMDNAVMDGYGTLCTEASALAPYVAAPFTLIATGTGDNLDKTYSGYNVDSQVRMVFQLVPDTTFVPDSAVTLTLYARNGSESGQVIPNAQISGYDGSGSYFSKSTNADGYVTITGIQGTWQLSVSKTGYQTYSSSLDVSASCTRNIALSKRPLTGHAPVVMSVEAQFDGDSRSNTIGTFISGCAVDNLITAYVSDPDGNDTIDRVVFNLGGAEASGTKSGDGWQATFNMGDLSGDTILYVTAYDNTGLSDEAAQQVRVIPWPDWLKASYGIEGGIGDWSWELSFIADEAAFEFTGAFSPGKSWSFYVTKDGCPALNGLHKINPPEFSVSIKCYLSGKTEVTGDIGFSGQMWGRLIKIDNRVISTDWTLDAGVTGELTAYLELVKITGFLLADIEFEFPTPWNFSVPFIGKQGVVPWVRMHMSLNADFVPADPLKFDRADGSVGVELGVRVKVGDENLKIVPAYAEIYLSGDGTIAMIYEPSETDPLILDCDESGITVSAGYKVKIGLRWWGLSEEYNGEILLWDWHPCEGEAALTSTLAQNEQMLFSKVDSHYESWVLDAPVILLGETPGNTVFSDDLPDDFPIVASDGEGNAVCVWTHALQLEPVITDLYCSFWNGSGWSQAQPITNDANAELNPYVAYFDGNPMVIWTGDAGNMGEADYETWASGLEIYYSAWNGSAWSEPCNITDNTVADGIPSLSSEAATSIAAWVSDMDGNISTTDDLELYSSVWNGSVWAMPLRLTDDALADAGPSVATSENTSVITWVRDVDANSSTQEDREIYYMARNSSSWSLPQILTSDSLEDSESFVACAGDGNFAAVWIKTEVINESDLDAVYFSSGNGLGWDTPQRISGFQADVTEPSMSFDPQGNILVAWSGYGNGSGDIEYCVREASTLNWSLPRKITEDDMADWQLSIADLDGRTMFTWLKHHSELVTDNGSITIQTDDDDVYYLLHPIAPDLAVNTSDISFSNSKPAPGEIITIEAIARNAGDLTSGATLARFYDGDPDSGGSQIGDDIVVESLAPDGNVTVSTDWTALGGEHAIYVVVDTDNSIDEIDETNNKACNVVKSLPDLTLESEDITFSSTMPPAGADINIIAWIHNIGGLSAENVSVKFFDGDPAVNGSQIGSDQYITAIAAGDVQAALVQWAVSPGSHNIYVIVDPGETIAELTEINNSASAIIDILPDLSITADDIVFSATYPASGQDVTINATIESIGGESAANTTVHIYDGNPLLGGILIANASTGPLSPGGSVIVSTIWAADLGNHDIYVIIDPEDALSEYSKSNNLAGATISVFELGDLTGDNHVNVLDMIRVGQHWGQTGAPGWIYEDVKPDGVINVLDMILIGQHWTG